MDFYDFLVSNNIDLSTFCIYVVAVFIGLYIVYRIPFLIMNIITLILVLFGNWNDVKRDKFLWHRDNYLYRKTESLYDDQGYCVKSIYYKYIKLHKLNKDGKK